MTQNTKQTLIRIVAIAGFAIGGFALAVVATTGPSGNPDATWTQNSASAPASNASQPINVGTTDQTKTGWLGLTDLFASNSFVYATGTLQDNQILVSQTVNGQPGVGVWMSLAPSCVVY